MAKKQLSQLQKARGVRIKVVGLGGGGGSIVTEMSQRLPGVSFVVADTDLVNLQRLKNDHLALFSFGSEVTGGLGTGMNTNLGQKVALAARQEVRNLVQGVDLLILVACLGGGVGSGALSVFAQAAREENILSIGVLTLPFNFEGQRRQRLAQRALKDSASYLDARMVLSNEKIFKVAGEQASFSSALSLINQSLAENLNALLDIIRQPSLINIDFSDLRAILRGHDQLAFLNSAMADGEKRLESVMQKIHQADFYSSDPLPADKLLLHIAGGADLKMAEVNAISQQIEQNNPSAQIIFGVDRRNSFKNQIKVTLLAISSVAEKASRSSQDNKVKKTKAVKKEYLAKPRKQKKANSSTKKSSHQKDQPKVEKTASGPEKKKKKKVKRLNALDVKELKKKSEFEKTSQEKVWEIPAFLRRKT
ncbi:MAG: cell division protein FtsZ [Patescibacteria group bacterium]|nr:cell division protein FtsZ [Patescibacteria group bacterium]